MDQRGFCGRPEELVAVIVDAWVGQRNEAMDFAGNRGVDIVCEHGVAGHQAHGESHAVALQAVEADIEADLPSLNSRRPAKVANGTARDLLEPDGLPDAGG